MRIVDIRLYRLQIPFKARFVHALYDRRYTDSIVVRIRLDDGTGGFGEILPRPYLTGETLRMVLNRFAPSLARRWLVHDFGDRHEVVEALLQELEEAQGRLATFCGFELALLDAAGRAFEFSAGELIGTDRKPGLEAGAVIDFAVDTEALPRHCSLLQLAGRKHIKVKVGRPDDLERLKVITEVLGRDIVLRIDANAAWSTEEALRILEKMRPFDIDSVEQPVAAGNLEGMRQIRETTGLRVMADESLCSFNDAQRLIRERAADVFAIRIGKCGGLLASKRLVELARQSGIGVHLGTLVGETGILSRAAEIFGERVPDFACVDGRDQSRSLLREDIIDRGERNGNACEAAEPYGLGVAVLEDRLNGYLVEGPVSFSREG